MNTEILKEHTLYLAWLWLFDQRIRLNKGGLFADQIIQQGKAEIPRIIQEHFRCSNYQSIFTDRWSL